MPTTTYEYQIITRDGRQLCLVTHGAVEVTVADAVDALAEALRAARADSYQTLTGGDTLFGSPGEGACRGPYTILQVTLTRTEDPS